MTTAVNLKKKKRNSSGWSNTGELLSDVYNVIAAVGDGSVDPQRARAYIGLFRVASQIIRTNLEFSKSAGRIKSGQSSITGFALR